MRRVEKREQPRDPVLRQNQLLLDSHPERARELFDQVSARVTNPQLLAEQRHLCVFCERRIEDEPPNEPKKYDEKEAAFQAHGLRRAHWVPLSKNPKGALDWRNIYASCNTKQTCDRRQGDRELGLRLPCNADHSAALQCRSDGVYKVRVDAVLTPEERAALEKALGRPNHDDRETTLYLNHPTLVRARAAAIDVAREIIVLETRGRPASREQRAAIADKLLRATERRPFVTVYEQYFRKQLLRVPTS